MLFPLNWSLPLPSLFLSSCSDKFSNLIKQDLKCISLGECSNLAWLGSLYSHGISPIGWDIRKIPQPLPWATQLLPVRAQPVSNLSLPALARHERLKIQITSPARGMWSWKYYGSFWNEKAISEYCISVKYLIPSVLQLSFLLLQH